MLPPKQADPTAELPHARLADPIRRPGQVEYFKGQLACCVEQAFVGSVVLAPLGTPEVLLVDAVDVTDSDSDAPPAHKWLITGSVAGIIIFFLLVSANRYFRTNTFHTFVAYYILYVHTIRTQYYTT